MKLQTIRGMSDILPIEIGKWQYLEKILTELLHSYGYNEIRTPILEPTTLFKRSIGDNTDIVEKEMYTFSTLSGDSLTMRPEGTASTVRAVMQNGLLSQGLHKLFYVGPMFRHEKPQKGRYRQFHQIGVEVFGAKSAAADTEIIAITAKLWQLLGIEKHVALELNTIGTLQARQRYREALIEYFTPFKSELDQDSQSRLVRSPIRILDSKDERTKQISVSAPRLFNYLEDSSYEHFAQLQHYLKALGIKYTINEKLVRGLDYYNETVFEWTTDKLGAQATVCGGGRYDGLVSQLGGNDTAAVGFAAGIERLLLLMKAVNNEQYINNILDIYICNSNTETIAKSLQLAEQLRAHNKKVLVNTEQSSLKSQFRRADKSGANIAIVIADDELKSDVVTVKFLRSEQPQQTVKTDEILDLL